MWFEGRGGRRGMNGSTDSCTLQTGEERGRHVMRGRNMWFHRGGRREDEQGEPLHVVGGGQGSKQAGCNKAGTKQGSTAGGETVEA